MGFESVILPLGGGRVEIEINANESGLGEPLVEGKGIIGEVLRPAAVKVGKNGKALVINIIGDDKSSFILRGVGGGRANGFDGAFRKSVTNERIMNTFGLAVVVNIGIDDQFVVIGEFEGIAAGV